MNNALLSGVAGLQVHQKMLDVAGNNLANVNTNAFKSSRISFAELLNETIRDASQPTDTMGGTNPMQIGSGVKVASVDRNMSQGSMVNTGQPLDMGIEGAGYFVLSNGQKDVYTRVGQFAVDSHFYLVDPATGYRVQRTGAEGVEEGFQESASNDIRIPYDVALPAKATETIEYTGNLSANVEEPTTNTIISSGVQFTEGGAVVSETTVLDTIDGASDLAAGDQLHIGGYRRDGSAVDVDFDIFDAGGDCKTFGDLLAAITAAFEVGGEETSAASLSSGEIRLTDLASGYSQTDLTLTLDSDGEFPLPDFFKYLSAGGESSRPTNIDVYDSQGNAHHLSAEFVRTTTSNVWDLVLTSVTGDVQLADRRINGISFNVDGSYAGLAAGSGDTATFKLIYANDPTNTRTLNVNLGTIGGFDGLAQFGGDSTVSSSGQDGYPFGWLSSLSVTRDGLLVGVFSNGARRDIAAMKLATFQNPAGLNDIGNNYLSVSANSGEPVATRALSGGAGAIQGGALEKSNVELATEFVNLIQAQNGFQANARTIKVADEMLRELSNLIS